MMIKSNIQASVKYSSSRDIFSTSWCSQGKKLNDSMVLSQEAVASNKNKEGITFKSVFPSYIIIFTMP